MDRKKRKDWFIKYVERTCDPPIVERVKDALKDPAPTEEQLWAALEEACAYYEVELRGPVNASVMRFNSKVRH